MTRRARWLFASAAVLALASLAVPLWGFRMSAAQYAGEPLHLRVGRSAISGDIQEITTLQKYVGVSLPTSLPELSWLTPAIAGISALLAMAGVLAATRAARPIAVTAAAALLVFMAASAFLLQKRLYEIGHDRDPRAPIQAIRDFTPPALGRVRVGNFTVWSYPHVGALALVAAAALALGGVRHAFGRGCPGQRCKGTAARQDAAA